MAINYLRRVQARYQGQGQSDVERGIQAGQAIGKLLGGLGTAIQGAQKNALANKLMTDQAIASQPGAGQTQDLGTLDGSQSGGPQPGPPANAPDPDPDPIQQPPQTFSNPSTGNVEPLQGQAPQFTTQDMPDLSQAVAQQKTASSLSTQPSASGDFTLNPSDYSGGGQTVGGLIHTGGVQELDLQKEMLAMQGTRQAQALAAQKSQMDLADRQAEASGTGRYAMDAALKRAQLLEAQNRALNPKTAVAKVDKNAPPTNFNGEPVTDDNQLNNFVDKQYGSGTSTAITNLISDGSGADAAAVKGPDGKPVIDPLTGQPKIASNLSVPLSKNQSGAVTKSANVSLQDLQTIVRQKNALRKKQGLSLYRVPGEDQSLGSITNPYPITSKLDMASRASGTYARLNGQTYKIP